MPLDYGTAAAAAGPRLEWQGVISLRASVFKDGQAPWTWAAQPPPAPESRRAGGPPLRASRASPHLDATGPPALAPVTESAPPLTRQQRAAVWGASRELPGQVHSPSCSAAGPASASAGRARRGEELCPRLCRGRVLLLPLRWALVDRQTPQEAMGLHPPSARCLWKVPLVWWKNNKALPQAPPRGLGSPQGNEAPSPGPV